MGWEQVLFVLLGCQDLRWAAGLVAAAAYCWCAGRGCWPSELLQRRLLPLRRVQTARSFVCKVALGRAQLDLP